MNKPIKNSYWVVEGNFLAGEYPGSKDASIAKKRIKSFIDNGIDCFINLTEEHEPLNKYDSIVEEFSGNNKNVILKRFPIQDVSVPNSKEYTIEILDFIDEQLKLNRKIYIHCWGGIGRTGTIVGCWLSRHGSKGTNALSKLKELWKTCGKFHTSDSPETKEQENYIINWSE